MKKWLISAIIASSIFSFSTELDARGSGSKDFRYYHYHCLDSNNRQIWFEVSPTYDYSLIARCSSDRGRLKITKVFW